MFTADAPCDDRLGRDTWATGTVVTRVTSVDIARSCADEVVIVVVV
jgi:hypothetical protein